MIKFIPHSFAEIGSKEVKVFGGEITVSKYRI